MKKKLFALCLLCMAMNFASAQEKVDEKYLEGVRIESITYAGITREYALYKPVNKKGRELKKVPLVIWNHGGGEYDGDIQRTLRANRGMVAWPEEGFKCAVLQIQVANPNYSYMAAEDEEKLKLIDRNNALQAEIVRRLIKDKSVDPKRIYVTGASSGGGATMRFVMQYPKMFAAALPCCAMDPIVLITKNTVDDYPTIVKKLEDAFQGYVYTWDQKANDMVRKRIDTKALLEVPMYYVHATDDPVVSVNTSKAYYQAMTNLGDRNNRLTLWSTKEMKDDGIAVDQAPWLLHFSWEKLLKHHEVGSPMYWLFKQHK